MDWMKLTLVVISLLELVSCSTVYEWHRVWESGSLTKEFAQILPDDKTVVHYSTETTDVDNTPAVTLHDYKFRAKGFKKGIAAIRPLLSEGNQVCFITNLPSYWHSANKQFTSYNAKSLSAYTEKQSVTLSKSFPSDLDPLSVDSVKEFCNVDNDHIFYMEDIDSVSGLQKLKVHTMLAWYNIGVPDNYSDTVFDSLTE